MAEVVLPRAARVFRAWRPDRFTPVDCTLCHGPGVIEGQLPHALRPSAASERRGAPRTGVREISGHHPAEAGPPGAGDE